MWLGAKKKKKKKKRKANFWRKEFENFSAF
jgi:hypothetical protein